VGSEWALLGAQGLQQMANLFAGGCKNASRCTFILLLLRGREKCHNLLGTKITQVETSPVQVVFCVHCAFSMMTDCVVETTCQYVSGYYIVSPKQAGRISFCSAFTGLGVLAPAMGYLPMVFADGGRIHRTMASLPYVECIIKVLLGVALFSSAAFRVRISPLPP